MPQFKAAAADVGERADVFVAKKYPSFSRSSLERLFDDNFVSIGTKVIRPAYRLKLNDKLVVKDRSITANPPKINIPIIYEDSDVIVLNKPEGVLTHSKGSLNTEATVASFIRPKIDNELEGNRAGIVHRLDRATSGVIITAKNKAAQNWLQKQFSNRKTKKIYIAVLDGLPKPSEAIIDVPLARNPKNPKIFKASSSGKSAQTHYTVLKTIAKNSNEYALTELKPKTGRTHQLRIHMAHIKNPIVGDGLYGVPGPNLLLHAQSLELTLPDRSRRVFTADPPKYFTEFIG